MPAPGPCQAETAKPPQCCARKVPWMCTRTAGHTGEHHAHGALGQCFCTWPQDDLEASPANIHDLALALVRRLEREGYYAAELDLLRAALARSSP